MLHEARPQCRRRDRVIDLLRLWLTAGRQLDVVTPTLSLFALSEMLHEVAALARSRILLAPASAELAVLGSDADRAARNRLQTRWLACRLAQWLQSKAEVRRALGAVPLGAFVVRDHQIPRATERSCARVGAQTPAPHLDALQGQLPPQLPGAPGRDRTRGL